MLIINLSMGQLCNQLCTFSSCIASSIEYNIPVKNYVFFPYTKYFKCCSEKANIIIPTNKLECSLYNLIAKFISKYRLWRYLKYTINEENCYQSVIEDKLKHDEFKNHNYWVLNWSYRDSLSFYKHRESIVQYFSLKEPYSNNVESLIENIRKDNDIIVGVHIRRGDYREWNNGKYYYDNKTYRSIINSIKNSKQLIDKKVAFVLCSNEKIDFDFFNEYSNQCYPSTGHFVEDCYVLSKCDYIIGPPSTYSGWASIIGYTPLLHIEGDCMEIDINDFKVMEKI